MNSSDPKGASSLPLLCSNGCGFYGDSSTRNLCSKCYRDYMEKERCHQQRQPAVVIMPHTNNPQQDISQSNSSAVININNNNNINNPLPTQTTSQYPLLPSSSTSNDVSTTDNNINNNNSSIITPPPSAVVVVTSSITSSSPSLSGSPFSSAGIPCGNRGSSCGSSCVGVSLGKGGGSSSEGSSSVEGSTATFTATVSTGSITPSLEDISSIGMTSSDSSSGAINYIPSPLVAAQSSSSSSSSSCVQSACLTPFSNSMSTADCQGCHSSDDNVQARNNNNTFCSIASNDSCDVTTSQVQVGTTITTGEIGITNEVLTATTKVQSASAFNASNGVAISVVGDAAGVHHVLTGVDASSISMSSMIDVKPSNSVEIGNDTNNVLQEDVKMEEPKQVMTTRCWKCSKRIGLVGFQCRCGFFFCGTHRYPDTHSCTFDYKTFGRDQLSKVHVKVVADKLNRI